ncbi:MAG TPA: hypothetical protein VLU91_04415 [Nitrososphaerales archaeon]|jgi:hypothetical protein|nr:hypothetical protein [Nitrososphaerales archaeon]
MSEDLVSEPFKSASERVDRAYDQAVEDLKSKVAKSKADALKRVSG